MSALSSLPIIPEMDFAPINSKVFLIGKNGTMPFASKVCLQLFLQIGTCTPNFLQHWPSARAADQSFLFFHEVSARNSISFLESDASPGTNQGYKSDSTQFLAPAGQHRKGILSQPRVQGIRLLIKLFQN